MKGNKRKWHTARNRNRKLQTSKASLKSQAQGTSLFTSADDDDDDEEITKVVMVYTVDVVGLCW